MERIVCHLELTFVAEKPPPAYPFEQVALTVAEESGEYEQQAIGRGERPALAWPDSQLSRPIIRPQAAVSAQFRDIDIRARPEYPFFYEGKGRF